MLSMVVTLDVSRRSGWLNASARCQVKCRAYEAGRGAEREARGRGGGSGASGARGDGPTQGCGGRARAERTKNMRVMSVTLDVSRRSGWLNATARCQVKCRAYEAGRGAEREARGRGGGSGASGARGEGPT
eukprot:scaffold10289_cov47-Phaeocystis_antarctica.AAC.4